MTAQGASTLKWGHPQVVSREVVSHRANSTARNRLVQQNARMVRDSHVIMAAWEEDDALTTQQSNVSNSTEADSTTEDHSVLVNKVAPVYDPFDEDDRLAFLPNDPIEDDPFDEPIDESIPEPAEDRDEVEDAIEQEIRRRKSDDDELDEQMEDLLDSNALAEEPLDEMDPLNNESDEDGLLQPEPNDLSPPDLGRDLFQDDQEGGLTAEELLDRSEELQAERRESEESCRKEINDVEEDKISSIELSIRVKGSAGKDFPYECAVSTKVHQPRQWSQITYNWKAAALCHKPLYFEQVQLERYGHSWGPYVQPIMSGVHFFGTLPVLPYKMGIRTPTECVYTLGYYRPGSCAPYLIDPIPFTWRALLFEGATATGISYVIP